MRRITALLISTVITAYLGAQTAIPPTAGNGIDVPYEIASLENLYWIAESSARWDYNYVQTADINAAETVSWFENSGWIPIGYGDTFFTGTYNGQGHTIDSLFIDSDGATNMGLFSRTNSAVIENLRLTNINITAYEWVGGLAGSITETTLYNCYVSGVVNGNRRTGGLIGSITESIVDYCVSEANIHGTHRLGGLIGISTSNSVISNCKASGDILGVSLPYYVGGLVSHQHLSTITKSHSTGEINGYAISGGLVGKSEFSIIDQCYSSGHVIASQRIGGLVGENQPGSNVADSYSRATINTGNMSFICGGLIGLNGSNSVVENSFSTGANLSGFNFGGLIGSDATNLIYASYWDTESSNQYTSAGGEGRTTSEMTHPYAVNTYVDWDFDNIWQADEDFSMNDGYPFLQWQIISPNPDIAASPSPASGSVEISPGLEDLSWRYIQHPAYTDPLGFRIYMNTTGDFSDDDYVWVDHFEEQVLYSTPILLPELDYGTTYYWQVVPTTNLPRREELRRDDAEDPPVWSFTTEELIPPAPAFAHSPIPGDEATDVPVDTPIGWTYTSEDGHTDPDGFFLNMWSGDTGADPFQVELQGGAGEHLYPQHFFDFAYLQTFYWQVIPFFVHNEEIIQTEDCPIWSFTTEKDTSTDDPGLPLVTELKGNYPNPFNPDTIISFNLSQPAEIFLEIFNLQGQRVRVLATGHYERGEHKITWNGKSDQEKTVASGIYFYRFHTEDYEATRKMILLK